MGLVFYATTKQQLGLHQDQISEILRTREKMMDAAYGRMDRITAELKSFEERVDRLDTPLARKVEGMNSTLNVVNDRINALTNNVNGLQVTNTARFDQFQKSVDSLEKRNDQMLQALDAQYNALNDHLRSHGSSGGIPRR